MSYWRQSRRSTILTLLEIDHTPQVHPASPTPALPNSFAAYRQKALQHGPLNAQFGGIGTKSGASLGPIEPGSGIAFDKSELPAKFYHRIPWTQAEIEAIESGGATTV